MDEAEIYRRLNDIFRAVFDDDTLVVGPRTTAKDIELWDSLNHIMLIAAIEKEFATRFSAKEVGSLKDVAEFVELIGKSTGNKRG